MTARHIACRSSGSSSTVGQRGTGTNCWRQEDKKEQDGDG